MPDGTPEETQVVDTGNGRIHVPSRVFELWEKYGWPTDEVLRDMPTSGLFTIEPEPAELTQAEPFKTYRHPSLYAPVDLVTPRLNLAQIRSLDPADYALRLATHPDTPIITTDRCSLYDLRAAVREGLRVDRADHTRRTHPHNPFAAPQGFDVGLTRIAAAVNAVRLVERSPAAMREAMGSHYWRSGMASTLAGKVSCDLFNRMLDAADAHERQAVRWERPLAVPRHVEEVRDIVFAVLVEHGVIKPYDPEEDPAS